MADFTGSFSGSFTGSYDILTHSDEYNGTTYGYVLHQRVGTGKAEKILLSDFFRDWLGSESGSAGIQDYGAGGYIFDSDRILIRSGSYVGSTFRPILKTATISNLFGGYSNGALRNTFIYARGVGRNTEASPTISSSMVLTVGGQILYEDNDGVGDLHGLTLTILEATDFSKVSTTRYNTALGGSTAAADSLATAIDGMSPTEIGVITSLGHWETYLSNNLRTAAKKVGLSKLGGYLSTDSGSAYAAVFYGTSGSAGVSDSLERLVAYRFTTGSNLDIPTATITTRVQSNTHGIYPFVNISDASSTNALYRYSANTASVTEPALLVNSDGEIESLGDVVTFKSDTATITLDMSSSSDTFLFVDGYVSTSGHIVPSTTELYDLGSTDLRWRDLYLSGSTIYLGSSTLSSLGGKTSGSFTGSFSGDGSNLVNVPGNSGTVTSITAGSGLNGGTITTSGTVSVDSGSMLPYYSSSTFNTVSGDATITSTGVISVVSSSYALTASHALNAGGGGSTSPGGSDGQVQYNNGGSFGGAAQLYYDDGNDRVGIGTNAPASLLEVQYTSGTGTIRIDQNEVAQGLYFTGRTGYDDYSIELANTNGLRFYNRGTSNTELQLRDGKVGIGTASPGALLHINGTGPLLMLEGGNDSTGDLVVPHDEILQVGHYNTGTSTFTKRFRIATTGEVRFYESTGTTANFLWDATNSRLGIGTTSPTVPLQVEGAISSSGIIYTTNQVRSDTYASLAFSSNSFLKFDDDNLEGTNGTVLGSIASMGFIIDTNNNGSSDEFIWMVDNTDASAATELMRLTDDGNLGIGTTSPQAILHTIGKVSHSITTSETVKINVTNDAGKADALTLSHNFDRDIGFKIINQASSQNFEIYVDGGAQDHLKFRNTADNNMVIFEQGAGTNTLVVDSNSRVGIGTASPEEPLTVQSTSGDILRISSIDTTTGALDTGPNIHFVAHDGSANRSAGSIRAKKDNATSGNYDYNMQFLVRQNGVGTLTERMRIDPDGNVGIGETNPANKLHVVGDIRIQQDADTGGNGLLMYESSNTYAGVIRRDTGASGALVLRNEATDTLYIKGGNVGIGTASPAEKLQVNGNLLLSGSGDVTLHISADTDNVTETHNPLLRLSQDGNLLNMDIGMAGDVDQLFTGQLQNSGYLWVKGYDFQIAYGNAGGGNDAITVLNSNGNVGIGDTTPAGKLEIVDVRSTSNNLQAFRLQFNDDTLNDTGYAQLIDYNVTEDGLPSGNISHYGLYLDVDASSTGSTGTSGQRKQIYGVRSDLDSTGDAYFIRGVYSDVRHTGARPRSSGDTPLSLTEMTGVFGRADADPSQSVTISNAYGVYALSEHGEHTGGSVGTVSNMYGAYTRALILSTGGSVNNAYGTFAEVEMDSTATLTNARAVYALIDSDAGTITNAYQFYGNYEVAGTITNKWGIYVNNADKNYISGDVGINDTAPDVKLSVIGTNGLPASSGTTPNGVVRIKGTTNSALFIGNDGSSPFGAWLQVQDITSLGTEYPLLLNPNGGNVGIGTTSPGELLHLSASGDANIRLENNGNGNTSAIEFFRERFNGPAARGAWIGIESDTSTNNTDLYIDTSTAVGAPGDTTLATNNGRIVVRGASSPSVSLYAGTAGPEVRLTTTGLGIGITSPNVDLHIKSGGVLKTDVSQGSTSSINANNTTNWVKIWEQHYTTASNFGSGGQVLLVQMSGPTSGQSAFMRIWVSKKQQGTSDFYKVVVMDCVNASANPEVAYKFDSAGGTESTGLLEIWVKCGVAYGITSVNVIKSQQGVYGTGVTDTGALVMSDTGTSTQPAGSTLITPLLTYDDSLNVGIGTTSPSSPLTVQSAVEQLADFYSTDTEAYIRIRDNNDSLYVSSDAGVGSFGGNVGANNSNLNIDLVTGNVGIGTTSPLAKLDVSTTANDGVDVLAWDTTQAQGANLRLGHSLNATVGTQTALTVNDVLGKLLFAGSDGTAFYDGAAIIADATQNYTGTNGGTRLEFYTTPTNTKTLTPQMMIDESGNVGIGQTSPTSTLDVRGAGPSLIEADGSTNGGFYSIRENGTARGYWGTSNHLCFAPNNSSNDITLRAESGNNIQFAISGDEYMRLSSTGRVGINTTSPESKLNVIGDIQLGDSTSRNKNIIQSTGFHEGAVFSSNIKYDGSNDPNTAANNSYIDAAGANNTAGIRVFMKGNGNEGGTYFRIQTAPTSVGAGSALASLNTRFHVGGDGQVGINNGSPSYNLDVSGTFRTTGNAILGDATADSHTINGKLTVTDDGGSTVAIETNGRFYSNSVNGGMWVGSGTNQFFGTRTSGATGKLGMFIGGQWRLIVDDNGYVGVGVDITPSYGLDVNASGTYGTIRATTDVIVTSDIRLKNELPDIVQGLEAVDKMRPIKYTLKDDEDENPKTHLGFSAQELLDIVPEVVSEDSEGIYNVAYQKLVPVLVKAIQELTEEVRELKKKVEE